MSTTSEEDERRRLSLLYNKQRLSTDNYNGSQIQSIEAHASQKPHHHHFHRQHQHNLDSKEVDLPVNGFHHEDGKGDAITDAPAHPLHHSASQPELRGDQGAGSDSPHEHSGHHHRHHHPHHHHHHLRHNGFGSDTDLVERSAMSAIEIGQDQGSPTKQKHGLVKRYLTTLHRNKSRKKLPEPIYVPVKGVNLRDVGAVTKGPMREGAVFRSSELLSKEEMQRNQVRTILDLRRMDRPCKAQKGNKASESTKTVLKYLLWGPSKIIPEKRLIPAHRAHPQPCALCHVKAEHRYDSDINVIHADLIPSTVGLRILQSMPWKVQLKTICYAIIGRGASSVMAPAVANDKLLGYKALYKTLLEDSKRGMAMAIRPFVEADNYPILVHCIHGKDRTGLIIMLLLMLCNVDQDAIVEDYVMSESVLKESRMHQELHMDVYLTSDDVIAATKETMEDTIEYVREKYGSAADYLKECGLEKEEIEAISKNLMRESELIKAEPVAFKPKFSLTESLTSGLQTLANPFKRRSSTFESRGPKPTMKPGVLGRVSEGEELGSRKSMSLENSPKFSRPADANTAAPESGRTFRRASLATTSLPEIRAKLAKLRLEHPELGPLTEEAPIDFLRLSDNSPDKAKKRASNGVRSLDLDVESLPKLEDKPSRFRLKKTISCPSTPHQNSGKWFRTNNSRRSDASGSGQGSGRLPSFPEIPGGNSVSSPGGNSVSSPENVVPSGKSVTILEPAAVQKPDSQGKLPSSPFA